MYQAWASRTMIRKLFWLMAQYCNVYWVKWISPGWCTSCGSWSGNVLSDVPHFRRNSVWLTSHQADVSQMWLIRETSAWHDSSLYYFPMRSRPNIFKLLWGGVANNKLKLVSMRLSFTHKTYLRLWILSALYGFTCYMSAYVRNNPIVFISIFWWKKV